MQFKPQPWDQDIITPQRGFGEKVRTRVLTRDEYIREGLDDFESRMMAEWSVIGGRLAVVKPNVTWCMEPTGKNDQRTLECERIAWEVVHHLKFKNFNEVYLVEWPTQVGQKPQGLKAISPVVSGLRSADSLDIATCRELLLRHPEAAAEFMAQKIITGDFDDVARNYVVCEDGQSLVRIDYGFAFCGEEKSLSELTTLMECVTLGDLSSNHVFRHRMRNIAAAVQGVKKGAWQHIIDESKYLSPQDKKDILEQLQTAPARLNRVIGMFPSKWDNVPPRPAMQKAVADRPPGFRG